jgi:5-methyltetrahydrofolate--homocysteine methyltransferase
MADQVGHDGNQVGQDENQIAQLSEDAIKRLDALKREGGCRIRIAARFDACHAEGDTIVAPSFRLPMLRQEGAEGRSLSDFVAPGDYGFDSPAGMFSISVHGTHPVGCECEACRMDYDSLLDRSLRLTLAEAASGWLDAELQKQLPKGSPVRIIKPAAGYASCPDHTLKRDILALLPGADQLDIRLTESYAMIPDASICGLVFAHPSASYPDIRHLPAAAIDAYATLRGFTPEEKKRFLGTLL